MTGLLLCAIGCLSAYVAGRGSFAGGMGVVLAWGYVYGILRANILDAATHFLFDAAVLGFFAARFSMPVAPAAARRSAAAKAWLLALIAWPSLLALLPFDNLLIQLVGLRYCVYFLPFLLLGARAEAEDPSRIARWLAVLNLAALAVALLQVHLGVEAFFPRNALSGLIYRSDVHGTGHLRIPSTFPHSHGYGVTMACTLPFLFHALLGRPAAVRSAALASGIVAAFLGLLLSASRSSMVIAAVALALLLVRRGSLLLEGRGLARAAPLFLLAAGTVAYAVVSGNSRLLRFQDLADADIVADRLGDPLERIASIAGTLLDYPLGNGLAGAFGVSIPYFLRDGSAEREFIGTESEFVRVAATQGIPGFFLWVRFLFWVFSRPMGGRGPLDLSRSFMYFSSLACIVSGFYSVGLLNAVPAAPLLFFMLGFVACGRYGSPSTAT